MGVEFDEPSYNQTFQGTPSQQASSKLAAFLIKTEIVKTEQQANMVLLGISIICIILTVLVVIYFVL